jgi:hypothetical protein
MLLMLKMVIHLHHILAVESIFSHNMLEYLNLLLLLCPLPGFHTLVQQQFQCDILMLDGVPNKPNTRGASVSQLLKHHVATGLEGASGTDDNEITAMIIIANLVALAVMR